jgi:GAF domain-containing protein
MQSDPGIHSLRTEPEAVQFRSIIDRLNQKLQRDQLVQATTDALRQFLNVDRVLLYHFYNEWEGRVTFESLSAPQWSIFGSTGPDQCFTDEYADLYLAGRVRSIEDIQTEPIAPCHRDFLAELHVRANLVVPILTQHRLWGLLVAQHCQGSRAWAEAEIARMKEAALILATAPSINKP